jgi:hypothetical protein
MPNGLATDLEALGDLQRIIWTGWALVIVVWLACFARIIGQRLYREAQGDWQKSLAASEVMIVDPQNSVAAFTDLLFSTWPYQVLLCIRALGPIFGILLVILSFRLNPVVPSQGDVSIELRALFTEQLPVHLLGMVHGALVFIGSEMLLVVTNIRFGIKSRNFATSRKLVGPKQNPFHELSQATGKATRSVTEGLAALREVMGEYRESIVSSMEKLQDGSVEMHERHFAEVQVVTAECSRVAEAIRDAANESGTMQPLLTTLSECTDRLSQQARELQSQVAHLDPRAFATGAAEVFEKLGGISESLDRTTATAMKNLESIVTATRELLQELVPLVTTLGSSESVPISEAGRAGKKTTRRSTDRRPGVTVTDSNPGYVEHLQTMENEGLSSRTRRGQ